MALIGARRALVGGKGIVRPFVADGATSPIYSSPTAWHGVYHAGTNKTWYCYEGVAGGVRVTRVVVFDHATEKFGNTYRVVAHNLKDDSHSNGGSLEYDDHDNWHLTFGPHNTSDNGNPTGQVFHYSTLNANDPSVWVPQLPVSLVTEYPTQTQVGSTDYLFKRSITGSDFDMACIPGATSASGVITWGAEQIIVDPGVDRFFWSSPRKRNGTEIHFLGQIGDASDTYRKNVYYLIFDTVTKSISNFDKSHSTVIGSQPIDATDLDSFYRLVASNGNNGSRQCIALDWDNAGNPHILYADDPALNVYHIANFGSGWTTKVQLGALPGNNSGGNIMPADDGGMDALWVEGAGFVDGGDLYRAHRAVGSSGGFATKNLLQKASGFSISRIGTVRDSVSAFRAAYFEITQDDADTTTGFGTMRGWTYPPLSRAITIGAPTVMLSPLWRSYGLSNITYSNGNLTATKTSGSFASAIANLGVLKTQNGYFEVLCVNDATPGSDNIGAGVASYLYESAHFVGFSGRSIAIYNTGHVFAGGSQVAAYGSFTTGDVIGVAIRSDVNKIWFRKNGGNWNNDPANNPVTNVGGLTMTSIISPDFGPPFFNEMLPAVNIDDANSSFTLRPTAASWSFIPPAGFSAPGSAS
jgi:SPRY domain